jgi:hypothetical protein
MRLLLLPLLLLAGVGGGYSLAGGTPDEVAGTCDLADCRVTVECTERGTCIVTCYDADGDIVCQQEIECDAPCDKPCDEPCAPSKACTR